MLQDDWITNF